MNWYILAFKNYAKFSGRSRRKEYWMFVLFNIILLTLSGSLLEFLGLNDYFGYIIIIYILIILIPIISLITRRLHDIGKSGSYIFVRFIPIIGGIWFLIMMCTDSEKGVNKYGIDPKNPSIELDDIGIPQA